MALLHVVDSADFLFLQRQMGLTWGNLSSHLSKLEDHAEYIAIEKDFVGKKLHTGRSRNDQVATDVRLYMRHGIDELKTALDGLVESLLDLAETILPVLTPARLADVAPSLHPIDTPWRSS